MFIKRGGNADGKIIGIVDPNELTEEDKKSVKKISNDSDKSSDSSKQQKKSGS
jgi:hypothetical protein